MRNRRMPAISSALDRGSANKELANRDVTRGRTRTRPARHREMSSSSVVGASLSLLRAVGRCCCGSKLLGATVGDCTSSPLQRWQGSARSVFWNEVSSPRWSFLFFFSRAAALHRPLSAGQWRHLYVVRTEWPQSYL